MVCISDGRANVPLSVSNGEPVSIVFRQLPALFFCMLLLQTVKESMRPAFCRVHAVFVLRVAVFSGTMSLCGVSVRLPESRAAWRSCVF